MRVIINTLIHLDENERRIVEEALRPYRVHTEVLNLPNLESEYQTCINRLGVPLREAWLSDTHRKLLDLRDTLLNDSHKWARESEVAPTHAEPGCIIAKPKEVFTMLSETRERQVKMCERAAEVIRNAMKVHRPVKEGARSLITRAEELMARSSTL